MAFYVVLGLGVYLTLKRSPTQGKNMLVCANNVVKYMPIDKSSLEMLSPIFDLTGSGFMDEGPRFTRGQNVMGGMGQNAMGGGGGGQCSPVPGGSGGSGIAVIKIANAPVNMAVSPGTNTITTCGATKTAKFTVSGTLTL